MANGLILLAIVIIVLQFYYLIFVFYPLSKTDYKSTKLDDSKTNWPAVSVVVIVKNELENLKILIPLLTNQNYKGLYDIHILDDHSEDELQTWLKQVNNPLLKIHGPFDTLHGKKAHYEIFKNIHLNEWVLCTDADCRMGDTWITHMVSSRGTNDVILGFSPYFRHISLVNDVIQFETNLTGLLYLGRALNGNPYMGVGRNILYRRDTLLSSNAYKEFAYLKSGDDDLTINHLKNSRMGISLHPDSFVYSIPKNNFSTWLRQKQRHVSTASLYRLSDKVLLFLFYATTLLWWPVLILVFFFNFKLFILMILCKFLWLLGLSGISRRVLEFELGYFSVIRADILYVVSLLYLIPAVALKKTQKW